MLPHSFTPFVKWPKGPVQLQKAPLVFLCGRCIIHIRVLLDFGPEGAPISRGKPEFLQTFGAQEGKQPVLFTLRPLFKGGQRDF